MYHVEKSNPISCLYIMNYTSFHALQTNKPKGFTKLCWTFAWLGFYDVYGFAGDFMASAGIRFYVFHPGDMYAAITKLPYSRFGRCGRYGEPIPLKPASV